MAEHADTEPNEDLIFARAIGKSMMIGLPVAFVAITLGVWLATGQSFDRALTAALLPSVLMGVFGGGFAGTIVALAKTSH